MVDAKIGAFSAEPISWFSNAQHSEANECLRDMWEVQLIWKDSGLNTLHVKSTSHTENKRMYRVSITGLQG